MLPDLTAHLDYGAGDVRTAHRQGYLSSLQKRMCCSGQTVTPARRVTCRAGRQAFDSLFRMPLYPSVHVQTQRHVANDRD